MPGSTTMSDADAFAALPDADFAREFGLPTTSEPAVEEGTEETGTEVEGEEVVDGTEGEDTSETPEDDAGEATEGEAEGEDPPEPAKAEKASEKKLAEFRAFDDEGDFDPESLAGLKLEYKAKGKTFVEPLDKIIRLAQMGRANQDKLDEAVAITGQAEKAVAESKDWQARYEAQRQLNIEMLENDDTYVDYATKYREKMTPEARLQQEKDAIAAERRQLAEDKHKSKAKEFSSGTVVPRLQSLKERYSEVSDEELFGVFSLVTTPWMGSNGQIDPAKWGALAEALDGGQIEQRLMKLHNSRVEKAEKVTAPLKRQATKAAEDATKAKRTLARATKAPGGGPPAAGSSTARKAQAANMTADQAAESVIAGLVAKKTW